MCLKVRLVNAPDDEVQAEIARLRALRKTLSARIGETFEDVVGRVTMIVIGCLIGFAGWRLAKYLVADMDISDKPISSLTPREIGWNLLAGLAILVSFVIAVTVAFHKVVRHRDHELIQQAQSNVAARKKSEERYRKSKVWGFLTDPNLGMGKRRAR